MDPTRPFNPLAIRHIPTVLEQTHRGERAWDVFSLLLKDRIVFLGSDVDDFVANSIVAQLLYLEAQDPERDISLYINSPGGSVIAGMAIYDTMQHIRPDVSTICVGHAMSMGALLLAAGTKGKRRVLPHARIMIHQPWAGGIGGQVTDIEIRAKQLVDTKRELNQIMAHHTGQTLEKVIQDTERDYFMSPDDALAYGIVDEIIARPKASTSA